MNFFDFMRNTFVTNEPVWNYYGTEIYTDPVASPGRSAQFIQDYFLQGQKGDIVYELDAHHDVNIHGISLLLSEYRATHTVSAFFLGIFLEDCLTQGQCGADLAVHGDFFPFSYLWFLTCLYHDYGYIVEENWKPSCRRYNEARICSLDGYYRLRNIKRELDITYSPYQQITPLRRSVQRHNKSHRETHDRSTIISYLLGNSPSLKDGLQFACGATVTGFRYPQKLLMQYFSYGIHRLFPPCYNHGIIGGYLLFDRLLKVYESAYRHRYPEHGEEYAGIESFEWSGKHFCIEQIPVFAHIADCVISHNVWKADASAEAEYLECGLGALVGERFKKILIRCCHFSGSSYIFCSLFSIRDGSSQLNRSSSSHSCTPEAAFTSKVTGPFSVSSVTSSPATGVIFCLRKMPRGLHSTMPSGVFT